MPPEITVPEKTPDAIKCPHAWTNGDNSLERSLHLLDIVEPILGVDLTIGERAYMRPQPIEQNMFITKDIRDTLLFPKGHRWEGRPRYNWVPAKAGAFYGYLVPGAQLPKIQPELPPTVEVINV